MKTTLAVMLVGLMGVLVGSLAAQPPDHERLTPNRGGIIFEGTAEVIIAAEDISQGISRGNIRVYDGWVVIEGKQIVPRQEVRAIILADADRRGDFGDQPGANPNKDAGRSQDAPPKRRPFRED